MKFGSLFAGIGGIDLGLERAGMTCAWQVEIDEYATKVLQKHWPNVARFRDVRDCGKENLEPVDLICGGFPCQDVSVAGSRAGLKGKRSTLWSEFIRIVREIGPRWILAENVPGLLSSDDGQFFAQILRGLAQSGHDAEWDIIPAAAFGAPHLRKRVFVVAYTNGHGCQANQKKQGGMGKASIEKRGRPSEDLARIHNGQIQRGSTWGGERPVCRVDDGLPVWVDRLRCLGNAVVPQVAEWIGRRIMNAEQLSF